MIVAACAQTESICVLDIHTGTVHQTFKSAGEAPLGGLSCVGLDYLVATQVQKSSIFSFQWHKDQPIQRSIPPEKLGAIKGTIDGYYVVGGGESGHMYIWETAQGNLIRAFRGHFRGVTTIAFCDDQLRFVSGGSDGVIHLWHLTDVLDASNTSPSPRHSWTIHSLPITDCHIGHGIPKSLLFSASQDCTCVIYDICSTKDLVRLSFPCCINSLTSDPTDSNLFAGGADGNIYHVDLQNGSRAFDGTKKAFVGHKKSVRCVRDSGSGLYIVSSSDDGTIRVWDISSRHALHMFDLQKGSITSLLVISKNHYNRENGDNTKHSTMPISVLKKFASETIPPESVMTISNQTLNQTDEINTFDSSFWSWCAEQVELPKKSTKVSTTNQAPVVTQNQTSSSSSSSSLKRQKQNNIKKPQKFANENFLKMDD
eukprot:c16420_g1_i1.p1 GENE.c16420_g1_i1~~c16420_g1_i1.p1  ORF type:complete len:427 (+),score=156.08 c16420_g1_i1:15-1295(+)